MSIHRVDVVRIGEIEKHPNADTLGVTHIMGFTVVVRLSDWKTGDLGAYIQPDSVVDATRPEFSFLHDGKRDLQRVRVKKLRGIYSMGLLIPAPAGSVEGSDIAELLGVTHYEPEIKGDGGFKIGGVVVPGPDGVIVPKYDIENLLRYQTVLNIGEIIVLTEKIHGANAKFCVDDDGKLHVGSRTRWIEESDDNLYWRAIRKQPNLISYLDRNRCTVAFGEVYGRVQSLRYGLDNDVQLALFDLLKDGAWMDYAYFAIDCDDNGIARVPSIDTVEWTGHECIERVLRPIAESDSIVSSAKPSSVREGIVIRPMRERWHAAIGRVQLKLISNRYLEKAE